MINIKGDVSSWKCVYKECGAKCCKPAKLTGGDVKRISETLKLKPEAFVGAGDGKGLFKAKSRNGFCVFLRDDHACELHIAGAVPLSCRMFPFRIDISYSDDIILTLHPVEGCPGYGRGKKLGDDFRNEIESVGMQFIREVGESVREKRTRNRKSAKR